MELFIGGAVLVVVLILITPPKKRHHADRTSGVDRKKTSQTENAQAGIFENPKVLQKAMVKRVIEGDTIIVSKPWGKLRIRLDAIDCPEKGQQWGDIAKYGLINLIGSRKIQYEEHCVDKYGRTVATIYVQQSNGAEWVNVNARMVTLGHAWVMRNLNLHLTKERQDELNTLERWARSKKVGLWEAENPVPPWVWRGDS